MQPLTTDIFLTEKKLLSEPLYMCSELIQSVTAWLQKNRVTGNDIWPFILYISSIYITDSINIKLLQMLNWNYRQQMPIFQYGSQYHKYYRLFEKVSSLESKGKNFN